MIDHTFDLRRLQSRVRLLSVIMAIIDDIRRSYSPDEEGYRADVSLNSFPIASTRFHSSLVANRSEEFRSTRDWEAPS
jgi:hypothetical protein